MASSTTFPMGPMDRSGSFFKLIDAFASEIGELKQEMVLMSPATTTADAAEDKQPVEFQGLEGEVSGLYLQSRHCSRAGGGERDSGYDSLGRRMSVLERLTQSHPVWLLLALGEEEARRILLRQPPGVFLVRRSATLQRKVLSVRLEDDGSAPCVGDFPIRESQYTFSLEHSGISFADLFRLVAFYCISRDILPFTLKLPDSIASAKSQKELEEVARLGAGFWDSALSRQRHCFPSRPLSRTLSPQRSDGRQPRGWRRASGGVRGRHTSCGNASAPPTLRTRPPPERSPPGGATLCLVNPLFLQAHRHRQGPLEPAPSPRSRDAKAPRTATLPSPRRAPLTSAAPHVVQDTERRAGTVTAHNGQSCFTPPPRPPPPRFMPSRRPAPPPPSPATQPPPLPAVPPASTPTLKSMPAAVATAARQPGTSVRRQAPRPPSMGSKSSSPAKKPSTAPTAVPSNPPPPRPSKMPDLEAHRCHMALDDNTIAKALSRAKLSSCQPAVSTSPAEVPAEVGATGSPPSPAGTNGRAEQQCLSDVSMSTSSDSLDYPRSPGFSLGLPPAPARHPRNHGDPTEDSSEDEEEDEEEEEEEEEDYGVGLENDLENGRLRRPFSTRKRKVGGKLGRGLSGGSFILPRALKGKFHRMSGVLGSLMTPERRAVKKIAELSREKGSYFGSLVQDYICFVQENRNCHTTTTDFLQTIRQFMTQMKAYLHQSSELDPPLESLIPEDQIDHVLEKAMHKCVLKPLKGVLEVALHDFQVSSGAWQQLKENLALAKAKRPAELGVDGVVPPDALAIQKIRHKFLNMRKMYSPEKKVSLLLRVCKLIYTIMQDNSGRMYGADDFLPMLTYVLAQCDLPQLDAEIQYMMELLDPSLLHGEEGYYLTSVYGAMSLIKNFQEEQAARVLSSETRNTLHQWHRRRTAPRAAPSVDDFQNYLRIALQEADSGGCTAKTLLVRPYSTTEEVCSLCAYKFKVADPENYALFLLSGDTSQQLAPDTHPQLIKSEMHSRPRAQAFHFTYRRVVVGAGLSRRGPAHLRSGTCPSC